MKWFERIFSKSAGKPSQPEPRAKAEKNGPAGTPPNPVWMEAQETGNPFGVPIVNCLSTAYGWIAMTSSEDIARRYVELRSSDGKQHIGAMPHDPMSFRPSTRLAYPFDGQSKDGPLFVASCMEEKWDAYLYDSKLYFSRSWTGDLSVRLDVRMGDGEVSIEQAHVARDLAAGDFVFATRLADFFVKTYIYRWRVPHPLPHGFSSAPMEVARFSFGLFGQQGFAATFEETLGFRPPRPA